MKLTQFHLSLLVFGCISISRTESQVLSREEECENEENQVEVCARDFLIFRNDSLPHTASEIDKFCRENKSKETCLNEHSQKCLSHSANQAITELIRSMAKQNQAICSNKNNRRLYSKVNQCLNKQSHEKCYKQLLERIHGIHQFTQEEKIPVICCSYQNFSNCVQQQAKVCGGQANYAIRRLIQNYAGETLTYVCKDYSVPSKCAANSNRSIDTSQIQEEIPKSFFSLLVKIYLS